MQDVHRRLVGLQGTTDPLETIADELAERATLICFDEFYVSDIGDAMLLGGLLKALLERDVVLVATSNVPPTSYTRMVCNGRIFTGNCGH